MLGVGAGAEDAAERVVAQRFEAKYVIGELQAEAITHYIKPFVEPDPHAPEYPVTSLYLDSPDLALYQSSDMGEKNRFKLRVRSYDDAPRSPLFLEVKQRIDSFKHHNQTFAAALRFAPASQFQGRHPASAYETP